ncbi:uncharacterized protein LOC120475491 isoform X2 [Pimephales promelas]|uniref:uncharacterized protein LOC120475491 isoform X2 n=1 Tax=Pimephales promelas TaxID=90988 RepID=UPI001955691D|nr:uncharacterized protein LOC120475491 isoform X2 [Pimephales promelas]
MREREALKMNGARAGAGVPSPSSPSRPSEHVLNSGAVVFPGVFDQHGCPLVLFPAEAQCKLTEELSREEVSHFIHYCLRLHSIRGEGGLLSVAVDLRRADLPITRFITDTLLLMECERRIIHSVYIVQPKKREVQKQLVKLLSSRGSKRRRPVLFRHIFLKEVFELSNYIDRSQLPSSLGGYLIYCHQSWAAFVKVMDAFVQEFLLVVNRLPSCISTLQSLSQLPVPDDLQRLRDFCSLNQARFQQLRRDLGLDDLLKHCECLLEKLRFPESDPCFQAMAGTVLYTHTALEMLRNYNRIRSAVQKVELLWTRVFSRAQVQLQMLRLQREARQIQEQMVALHRQKLQAYRTEVAEDTHGAEEQLLTFEASVYTHAMALVRRADDVMHTLAETVPEAERTPALPWLQDLEKLKQNLCSAARRLDLTLRSAVDFHHARDRCKSWCERVLCAGLLQELLWSEHCGGPAEGGSRRPGVQAFLRRDPGPEEQELLTLTRLAHNMSQPSLQQDGTQLSHRCMTLRRLLTSTGAVPLHDLHLALQWQYEYLKGHHRSSDITSPEDQQHTCSPAADSGLVRPALVVSRWPSVEASPAAAKPPSLSSFDSGFDGAGNAHLHHPSRRENLPRFLGNGDSAFTSKQVHEDIVSVSDSEEQEERGFGLQRASIQIVPKITSDSVNLEIKVKRSSTLPRNPWLSLPIDDLESSYTVTITPGSSLPRSPTQTQPSFEESELTPVGNVLSSTLTDSEEKPSCSVDGDPSLQWDSFDLHNLRRDSLERVDVSLGDWAEREQQELKEVETTLERTAEILQEEEDVLAQEVVLDELLRSEDLHKHWPEWTEARQHSAMSPQDLVESGVIGLDDVLQSEPSSTGSETLRTSESDSDAPGLGDERPVQLDTRSPEVDRRGILRDLQVLDEQIMEEQLKLEALHCTETEPPGHVTTRSSDRERRMFLAQLEDERREVEKMERSLSREMKARMSSSKGRRVVKCSVMERNSKLKDLDGELLRNCRPESTRQTQCASPSPPDRAEDASLSDASVTPDRAEDASLSDASVTPDRAEDASLTPDRAEDASLSDVSVTPEPLSSTSGSIPNTSLSEIGIGGPAASDSESLQEASSGQGEPFVLSVISSPDQKLEDMDTSEGSSGHSERPESETSFCVCTDGGDSGQAELEELEASEAQLEASANEDELEASANEDELEVSASEDELDACASEGQLEATASGATLEASGAPLTQNSGAVRDAFDPGGVLVAPVAGPRRPVPLDGRSETPPPASEHTRAPVESATPAACAQSTSQSLYMQNNNNNTAVLRRGETCGAEIPEIQEDAAAAGPCVGREGGGSTRAACRSALQLDTHRQMSDYQTAIVLDSGSGLIKAGFADQDLPTTVFPTVIGRPKYEEVLSGSVDRAVYIGHDAQHMRGVLALKYPIRNGIVRNWDEMEMIWDHAFQRLAVRPEDHPVLLTEAAMNPRQNRQRMVELMFEAFSVPLAFVALQAVLALYASGRTTGVVLDSGDGVSHSVPVFEGYCLPHAVQRFNLAGADVTLQLQKLLLEQGVCMRTSAELEIVREMKESSCCVALDYEAALETAGSASSEVQYTLPDGRLVSLGSERFRAPEILFRPELIGRDHYGMQESVFRSIMQSDIDLRRSFVGNILLSGGNTLLPGLPERLQQEVCGVCASDLSVCVRVVSPPERDSSVWSGGAALASRAELSGAWISAQEYQEFGPHIVFRKCF